MLEIYRIIHRDNLDYILRSGRVVAPNHPDVDPNYVPIGNNEIIARRSNRSIPVSRSRTFRDYVAFYFGYRSIMLYNIHTGFGEVERCDQSNIIYLVYDAHQLVDAGYDFFFTDGQGNQGNTRFFDRMKDIDQVDLSAAHATDFSMEAQKKDPDIKRKKHAEFHVYGEIDLDYLLYIAVCNEEARRKVLETANRHGHNITISIKPEFYY